MAKRNIPTGQVNKQTLKKIKDLMESLDQKYSIKVGILQSKGGREIAPGTNMTRADLGAVHEFGANIKHPGGQPYYINSSTGMAVFVSKNSLFGQHLISKGQVTKPHEINVPARPFLRPLLDRRNKKVLLDAANLADDSELNKLRAQGNSEFLDKMANRIASTASLLVQHAFNTGGYPEKWKDITKYSREHRKYDHTSPPLTDSGWLREKAFEYEVTKGQ